MELWPDGFMIPGSSGRAEVPAEYALEYLHFGDIFGSSKVWPFFQIIQLHGTKITVHVT